jgi:hypothetical protein
LIDKDEERRVNYACIRNLYESGRYGGRSEDMWTLGTHIDESGWPQEKVILLELLRMNNAEVSTDAPLRVATVGTLELELLSVCEIGHGALELRENGARSKCASGKNTELRLAGTMRVPLCVGDLNGAGWEIELHVAGSMAVFMGERGT